MNEKRRLNAAGIHCAQLPSCPISDEFPPPEAPTQPWAELGPQKTASAWCTTPSNHNRGHWLNLLCTALKKTTHTAIVRVIPPIASEVCMGHGAVSRAGRAQSGGARGPACLGRCCREQPWCPWGWLSQAWQTSHSAGLCCATDLQREPTVLWLLPRLCVSAELVGVHSSYHPRKGMGQRA